MSDQLKQLPLCAGQQKALLVAIEKTTGKAYQETHTKLKQGMFD